MVKTPAPAHVGVFATDSTASMVFENFPKIFQAFAIHAVGASDIEKIVHPILILYAGNDKVLRKKPIFVRATTIESLLLAMGSVLDRVEDTPQSDTSGEVVFAIGTQEFCIAFLGFMASEPNGTMSEWHQGFVRAVRRNGRECITWMESGEKTKFKMEKTIKAFFGSADAIMRSKQ